MYDEEVMYEEVGWCIRLAMCACDEEVLNFCLLYCRSRLDWLEVDFLSFLNTIGYAGV